MATGLALGRKMFHLPSSKASLAQNRLMEVQLLLNSNLWEERDVYKVSQFITLKFVYIMKKKKNTLRPDLLDF